MGTDLLAVGESVVVGVVIERVGAVGADLIAVGEPVVVGVVIQGVGAVGSDLVSVGETVAVGVIGQRVGARHVDLISVGESVVVGVVVEWVGAVVVDLFPIGESVVVRVGVEWVGAVGIDLLAVGESVVVGVVIEGIGSLAQLVAIRQAIAVGVVVERVGFVGQDLVAIGDAVAVRVRIGRVGPDVAVLFKVREAVSVGVKRAVHDVDVEDSGDVAVDIGVGVEKRCVALAAAREVAPGAGVHVGHRGVGVGTRVQAPRSGGLEAGCSARHAGCVWLYLGIIPVHVQRRPGATAVHLEEPEALVGGLDVLADVVELAHGDDGLAFVGTLGDGRAGVVRSVPGQRGAAAAQGIAERDVVVGREVEVSVPVQVADDANRAIDTGGDLEVARRVSGRDVIAGPGTAGECGRRDGGSREAVGRVGRRVQVDRELGIDGAARAADAPAVGSLHARAVGTEVVGVAGEAIDLHLDDCGVGTRTRAHHRVDAAVEAIRSRVRPGVANPGVGVHASERVDLTTDRDVPRRIQVGRQVQAVGAVRGRVVRAAGGDACDRRPTRVVQRSGDTAEGDGLHGVVQDVDVDVGRGGDALVDGKLG